jgi:hypothetical protein
MTNPAGVFPTGTPNQVVTGILSAVNNAVTLATDTLGSVTFTLDNPGGVAPVGASVIFESTGDNGANWLPATAYQSGVTPQPQGSSDATAAGSYNVTVGGKQQVRVRLTAITSGSFSVTAVGTKGAAHIGVKNSNAADLNATVVQSGSAGVDYSSGKPALPTVQQSSAIGTATFGGSSTYAAYVLVSIIPSAPTRAGNNVEIINDSGSNIVAILDDGTAAVGSAPNNASVRPISPTTVGNQGGAWSDQTFKGRVQIYAQAGANAQVMARGT